jgi:hypothetical protein
MANHDRERLQGWAAPQPSEPGWRERAIAAVRARQHEKRRHNERKNGLYLFFDDPLRVYLDEACHRRNISLTGYARRALVAFLAHDLDVPLEEIAQHTAVPAGYGATGGGRLKRTTDNGKGMGLWRILGLGE